MTPPVCPVCAEAEPDPPRLHAVRADTRGQVWCWCPACHRTLLLDRHGVVVRSHDWSHDWSHARADDPANS